MPMITDKPQKFTFTPTDTRGIRRWSFDPFAGNRYKRRYSAVDNSQWCAPEHSRFSRYMERRYPVDELGERIDGLAKQLVLDPRPVIMMPVKPVNVLVGA